MLIKFNTFQKHSADSTLSTNMYLMSVAAYFKVKVDVTLFSVLKQSYTQFDIVYKFNAIIATIY